MKRAERRRRLRGDDSRPRDRYPWLRWVLVGVLVLAVIGIWVIATGRGPECPKGHRALTSTCQDGAWVTPRSGR